jgi:oxygen-independent coproporphyrinogen-3 oxidase
MNYWERGEYLGLGPGAWSFISGRRHANIGDVTEYARRLFLGVSVVETDEVVGMESAARETILLGLRTMKGLDLIRFEREYGRDLLRRLERNAALVRDAGLLLDRDGALVLSDRGILLSNEVVARLVV